MNETVDEWVATANAADAPAVPEMRVRELPNYDAVSFLLPAGVSERL